jgi:hypothetical protein
VVRDHVDTAISACCAVAGVPVVLAVATGRQDGYQAWVCLASVLATRRQWMFGLGSLVLSGVGVTSWTAGLVVAAYLAVVPTVLRWSVRRVVPGLRDRSAARPPRSGPQVPADLVSVLDRADESFDQTRRERTPKAVGQALTAAEQALAACRQVGDADLQAASAVLVVAVRSLKFEVDGDLSDLTTAAATMRWITQTSPDPELHDVARGRIVAACVDRYQRVGDTVARDWAVDVYAPAEPDRSNTDPQTLTLVCGLLQERVDATRDVRDADTLVAWSTILVGMSAGAPDEWASFWTLADARASRYRLTGDGRDLDAAIAAYRRVVEAAPPDAEDLVELMSMFIRALVDRFDAAGNEQDLVEARTVAHAARDVDDDGAGDARANLVQAYAASYERGGAPGDLDVVLRWSREIIDDPSRPSKVRSAASHTVAHALREQAFRLLGQHPVPSPHLDRRAGTSLLHEAIAYGRQAVELCPVGSAARLTYGTDLANMLLVRHDLLGGQRDLDEARALVAPAVDGPTSGIDQLRQLTARAGILHRAGADLAETEPLFRRAASAPGTPAAMRVATCQLWAEAAMTSRPSSAVHPYSAALDALAELGWLGVDRAGAEYLLMHFSTLGTDATACALAAGTAARAAEMSEQGRATLWSRTLNLGSDTTVIARHSPDLARKLDRVRAEIRRDGFAATLGR